MKSNGRHGHTCRWAWPHGGMRMSRTTCIDPDGNVDVDAHARYSCVSCCVDVPPISHSMKLIATILRIPHRTIQLTQLVQQSKLESVQRASRCMMNTVMAWHVWHVGIFISMYVVRGSVFCACVPVHILMCMFSQSLRTRRLRGRQRHESRHHIHTSSIRTTTTTHTSRASRCGHTECRGETIESGM